MPKYLKVALALYSLVAAIGLANYFGVHRPANNALDLDDRNAGISVLVHYGWFVNPMTLVFDLRRVDEEKSPTDIARALFQVAHSMEGRQFNTVVLSYRGSPKFSLTGRYFRQIGAEYGEQNPIYTLRTLPANVYTLDGDRVYPDWEGGVLGVTNKQLDDLNDFFRRWFVQPMMLSQ